jgi:hypothetical protein
MVGHAEDRVQQCELPPDRVVGTLYLVVLISETVCTERSKLGQVSVGSIPNDHLAGLSKGFFISAI